MFTGWTAISEPLATQLRWTRRVAATGIAVVLVLIVAHAASVPTVDWPFLNLNVEQNLPSWFSTVGFALAGLACLAAAVGRSSHWTWGALGLLMLVFSLDDLTMAHEFVEEQTDEGIAILIIQPLAVLAVLALYLGAARSVGGLPRLLVVAALLALVGAQAGSSVGYAIIEGGGGEGLLVNAVIILEEASEILTSVFLLSAALQPLLENAARLLPRATAAPSSP
jgi:hypothetical protein